MNKKLFAAAGLITLIALALNYQFAFAHESITAGDYEIVYGWVNEPPIAGQMNGIQIFVHDMSSGEEQPAEEQVIQSLVVELSYGSQSKTLTLEPVFDTAGAFDATVIPTIPGIYSLEFTGTLGDTAVDANVELEEVQAADAVQFPSEASAASTTSTNQETAVGTADWVVWLSLLLGLAAVGLAAIALRRPR